MGVDVETLKDGTGNQANLVDFVSKFSRTAHQFYLQPVRLGMGVDVETLKDGTGNQANLVDFVSKFSRTAHQFYLQPVKLGMI